MKNFISLTVLVLLLTACSSDPDPVANTAPSVPTLATPLDNACLDLTSVVFTWNASTDPQSNPITYTLEVSESSTFAETLKSVEGTVLTQTIADLVAGKKYYWRVKAKDDQGLSSEYSTALAFTTGITPPKNQLPYTPELVLPALYSQVTTGTVTLSWTGSDPDAGDTVKYEVYFGKRYTTPIPKVAEKQDGTTYEATLTEDVEYIWYVIAYDSKGESTTSQYWFFTKKAE